MGSLRDDAAELGGAPQVRLSMAAILGGALRQVTRGECLAGAVLGIAYALGLVVAAFVGEAVGGTVEGDDVAAIVPWTILLVIAGVVIGAATGLAVGIVVGSLVAVVTRRWFCPLGAFGPFRRVVVSLCVVGSAAFTAVGLTSAAARFAGWGAAESLWFLGVVPGVLAGLGGWWAGRRFAEWYEWEAIARDPAVASDGGASSAGMRLGERVGSVGFR